MNRRLSRIDELAQEIPPARDLWPAIAAAIESDKAAATVVPTQSRRYAGWRPAAGLAASVVLVTIGVLIGQNIGHQPELKGGNTALPANSAVIPASLRDAEYRKQRDELRIEVQTKLKSMPPAEREKVAASLRTLQSSITEIQAALGRDPANALLQELLVNSCQEEMRALTVVRDSGREEI